MSGDDRATWHKAYDAAERRLTPPAAAAATSDQAAVLFGVATRVGHLLERGLGTMATRVWHAWNLPAGTDVRQLRLQIAELERQVRDLHRELAETRRELGPSVQRRNGGRLGSGDTQVG